MLHLVKVGVALFVAVMVAWGPGATAVHALREVNTALTINQ